MELVTVLCLHQGGEQSTLTDVSIEFCTLSICGWNALGNALQELRKLKRLYLRQVHVKNENGETLPESLTNGLLSRCCPNLEHLYVVDCHLNAMTAQTLARQLSSLKSSNKLQVLSLEGNSIGNAGVKCLSKALEHNTTTLGALDIDRVGCSTDAWLALAESLKYNTTLKSLSCSGNGGLDPICMKSESSSSTEDSSIQNDTKDSTIGSRHLFEDLLCVNATLQRIITPSQITPQVEFFLRLNRAGRKWIGENIMTKIFPFVLQRINRDPDVIFYFLRAQSGNYVTENT